MAAFLAMVLSGVVAYMVISQFRLSFMQQMIAFLAISMVLDTLFISLLVAMWHFFQTAAPCLIPILASMLVSGGILWWQNRQIRQPY